MVMRGAGSAQINTNTYLIERPRPERLLLNGTDRLGLRDTDRERGRGGGGKSCQLAAADYGRIQK